MGDSLPLPCISCLWMHPTLVLLWVQRLRRSSGAKDSMLTRDRVLLTPGGCLVA
jgi:hypothetical protein